MYVMAIGMMAITSCSSCAKIEPEEPITTRLVHFRIKLLPTNTIHIYRLDSAHVAGDTVAIMGKKFLVKERVK